MPDAAGNIKGISLSGVPQEVWDRIYGPREYTQEQQDFMDEAVKNRKPLPEPPLPIDD